MNVFVRTARRVERSSIVAGALGLLGAICTTNASNPDVQVALGTAVAMLATFAAIGSTIRMCLPGYRLRHWGAFVLAILAVGLVVVCVIPAWFPTAFGSGLAAIHLAGATKTTARVRREPCMDAGRRRGQILMCWLLPIVGFATVSAFYRHIDEPSVDDGFPIADDGYY